MDEDIRKESPLHAATRPTDSASGPASQGALDEIFQQHHTRVVRAAYRVTGNAADAEDVLQTVFLRLARRERPPGPPEALGPYLHRAAVNAGLDLLRSRQRAKAVPLLDDGWDGEDPSPGPEQQHAGRELKDRLRQAIAELSPRAAEIFTLRYLEGYGNKEIAQLLGSTQTAIGVHLHRSRGLLQESLASFVGDPS